MMGNDIANIEAERSVIGALVFDSRVLDQARRLTEEDFTVREYRSAFREIQRLLEEKKPVDLVTVGERLGDENGVITAVVDAGSQTPVTFNAASYVDLVLDASLRRTAGQIGADLYRVMGDRMADAQGAIAQARAMLADVGTKNAAEWVSSTDIAARTLYDLEARVRGDVRPVRSGIDDLDRLTGGFFPGELTIIGAKPGAGKSVFGMMTAINAARAGFTGGVCSLEMVDTQYGQRLLSSVSGVDGMKIRKAEGITGEDWELITKAALELSNLPAGFLFAARYIEDLALAVQGKIDRGGMDILVVDYLQLLKTRKKTENERLSVAAVSWALKCLAVYCRITVIAMAQLRRPGQGEANRMPTMRDLRESGNLEADADNVILLHEPETREDPYVYSGDKEAFDQMRKEGNRYIAMKVEKQRQGSTGLVSVLFQPRQMRYQVIERTSRGGFPRTDESSVPTNAEGRSNPRCS